MKLYDIESGTFVTLENLRATWENDEILRAEYPEFRDYYSACMVRENGSIVEIPENLTGHYFIELSTGKLYKKREMLQRLEEFYNFDEFTPMSETWEYFADVNMKGE